MFTVPKIKKIDLISCIDLRTNVSQSIKLILTGGKIEKNIDHFRFLGLLCLNLHQITDSHVVNDFRIKTF